MMQSGLLSISPLLILAILSKEELLVQGFSAEQHRGRGIVPWTSSKFTSGRRQCEPNLLYSAAKTLAVATARASISCRSCGYYCYSPLTRATVTGLFPRSSRLSSFSHCAEDGANEVPSGREQDAFNQEAVNDMATARPSKTLMPYQGNGVDRRGVFQRLWGSAALAAATASAVTQLRPLPVSARGLVQFPCTTPLANSYHFMRSGTTLLEEEGMWSTNPLFLTNREDALSVAGQEQVVEASQLLKVGTRPPTLVKYSLAAGCMDSANIVARELKLGRDRLVPEFTFMDPRAIGRWDLQSRDVAAPAVWAMDNDEAGVDGINGRPPANEDGTPNEVLADQAVRLRQLLSILESQYSGDTILLVFPDGTGPALLSCMIAGIPYNRVHELEYGPGEIRFDVTRDTTLALWKSKQGTGGTEYQTTLRRGRENLTRLRAASTTSLAKDGSVSSSSTDGATLINLKDQKLELERQEIEAAWKAKEKERIRNEQAERADRQARLRELEAARPNGGATNNMGLLATASVVVGGAALLMGRGDGTANTDGSLGKGDAVLAGVGGGEALYAAAAAAGTTTDAVESTSRTSVMGRFSPGGRSSTQTTNTARTVPATSDLIDSVPVPPLVERVDPKAAAERAMEEYLNKDDGADDWLTSLSQIIADPVDDDVNQNSITSGIGASQSTGSQPTTAAQDIETATQKVPMAMTDTDVVSAISQGESILSDNADEDTTDWEGVASASQSLPSSTWDGGTDSFQ